MRNPIPHAVLVLAALISLGGLLASTSTAQESRIMPAMVTRFSADWSAVSGFYLPRGGMRRHRELSKLLNQWETRLNQLPFDQLGQADRIDAALLENQLQAKRNSLELIDARRQEALKLLPFLPILQGFEEGRRDMKFRQPKAAARTLSELSATMTAAKAQLSPEVVSKTSALRANKFLGEARRSLEAWFENRSGYDPLFTWWVKEPFQAAAKAIKELQDHLGKEIAGQTGKLDAPLVGEPIGAEALAQALQRELIANSAEELLAIGEREFAWCETQLELAAKALKKKDVAEALEFVKQQHVAPGDQPAAVKTIAEAAIAWLKERELVSIPALCETMWNLEMLSAKRQRTLPFAAYGGNKMLVAFPSIGMGHTRKEQSLRGNNLHFTRIVTPHELIPGHHLQRFMAQRHAPWRSVFSTPFLVEGWALHWEMLMWDMNWARGPKDQIGMLFWRRHRCARIIVSLNFHLGRMSPDEMVEFLVTRVGLERDGARAEVRRYIGDSYGPLYQCGYMIGGLQLRQLYKDMVTQGGLSPRDFHDRILRQGPIPIAAMRAALSDRPLRGLSIPYWRF